MFLFAALCSLPPMAGELAAIPFGELGWECLAGIGYVVGCATFVCYLLNGTPRLTEHHEIRWRSPDEMLTLDWAPADREAVQLICAMDFTRK